MKTLNNMRALVIDDDKFMQVVFRRLASTLPFLDIEYVHSPLLAMELLQEKSYDMIFLDVEMPDFSGFQFLKQMDGLPPVVIVSGYEKYAVRSYNFEVIDYLVKPVVKKHFHRAVFRTRKLQFEKKSTQHKSNFIYVKKGDYYTALEINKISWITIDSDYLHIHTQDEEEFILIKPLKVFLNELPAHKFLRVHRSYAVAIDQIEKFSETDSTIIVNGREIPVSRTYRHTLKDKLRLM
ncbi:MAG: LytR/AlgR family response regulator transcription factor [Bacteroidota bacterium]